MSRPKICSFGLPKRNTFWLHHHEETDSTSDSEDSDYQPGRSSSDEESSVLYKNRVKKSIRKELPHKTPLLKKITRSAQPPPDAVSTISNSTVVVILPDEILIKIFQYCVLHEGVFSFLARASRVCKDWYRISHDLTLFEILDLSCPHFRMVSASLVGLLRLDLSLCRFLSLSGQWRVPNSTIKSLLSHVPGIIGLDLFNCANIQNELVKQLPQLCPNLSRLQLSFSNEFNEKIKFPAIQNLIMFYGSRLRELRLARVLSVKTAIKNVLQLLQENCPNLEELDLRMIPKTSYLSTPQVELDIMSFVQGCPKLKELRLDGFPIASSSDSVINNKWYLRDLKTFSNSSCYCPKQRYNENKKSIFSFIFENNHKLTELDISRSDLNPYWIYERVKEVECLYIADMHWDDSTFLSLSPYISTWCWTIRFLDLSCNSCSCETLRNVLSVYVDHGDHDYALEEINLDGTCVQPDIVKNLVHTCKKLQNISLTSCRELPRGCKLKWEKKDFNRLLVSLSNR